MHPESRNFKEKATAALGDANLQRALGAMKAGFVDRRRSAVENLPEFEVLRGEAAAIKDHTLAHLDLYLLAYEKRVIESGGVVHWARDAAEARKIILVLAAERGAKTVTKGKSMVTEEIALNAALEAAGMTVVETDLGEYILQIRGESPSHIIAPAVHVLKEQVAEDFRRVHEGRDPDRPLVEPETLINEAREELRDKYPLADMGITGANFLIAETGTSVIVTNEGNGDLTQTLGKVHVVVASLEKVVPTLEDAATILRLLARSGTGQDITAYTTFSTGPRRPDDPDGPAEYHVVLIDNGRSEMLGTEFQDMLRCIRCGACMNHCPVYGAVGGHAYGWVYPGPMGAVLTPGLIGVDEAGHLPNASTFCGRCADVCPMKIPLPDMMRAWRKREFERKLNPPRMRLGLAVWGFLAKRPRLYRPIASLAAAMLFRLVRGQGKFRSLPLAGGWTKYRDLPAPVGRTFQDLWATRRGRRAPEERIRR